MNELEFDHEIDKALEFQKTGKMQQSLGILSNLVNAIPDNDVKTLRIVGALFLAAKDFNQAISCYKKVIESYPESAEASIGLFHALVNAGREKDAFAELRRFLSISESEEHFRLIEEMRDAFLDEEKGKVILKMITENGEKC